MKVLFICSGNRNDGINVIIKNQGESLLKVGLEVDYLTIKGKGLKSYLRHIPKIRDQIRRNKYDIIHAHYSFSAFTATIARCKPLVVSLMGSDVYSNILMRMTIRFCCIFLWDVTIVKSSGMKDRLHLDKCRIIPNGVNLDIFKQSDKKKAREILGLKPDKYYVMFAADPSRPEKNFILAQKAVLSLDEKNIELLIASAIPNSEMPLYYSAADVLLLTSVYEGSVNVVKEGMACNIPIVSTDVGDIKENISSVSGCFICNATYVELAEGLKKALMFSARTNGRDRILELGLNSDTVAKKLIGIYECVI
jgi:teichuronic acid biosynthesis glycosyltransferase TuaC